MILPGTYIAVLDEGLISVGGISVGNVGIVGTARGGDVGRVYTLSSFSAAREIFAAAPEAPAPEAPEPKSRASKARATEAPAPKAPAPETLLRSLELLFGNGASTVYAVRAADDSVEAYAEGLALLENQLVNIVLLAGQDAGQPEMVKALRDHLNATAQIRRERIGIVGSNGTADVVAIKGAKPVDDSGRLIYVAPGLRLARRDPATGERTEENLSGAYTAAALAGLLATLPVQSSPTNKTLTIGGLTAEFNHGQLEDLVGNNVLVIERRDGFRVVKGITTSQNVAWHQITTRRIVDKALYGTRSACNPYIGKLNNPRVRGALKATLDGFLTRMVEEESLRTYQLAVTATRPQEIAGQCVVTMSLQPTFSIDYVVVTMFLG